MRKSNLSVLILYGLVTAGTLCFMAAGRAGDVQTKDITASAGQPETPTAETPEPSAVPAEPASMEHTLMIGDSRTVGLMEYAEMKGPDFFCSVGMTVFDAEKTTVSVPGYGKTDLFTLLQDRNYERIYIMLGINELGYPFEKIVRQYEHLVTEIRRMEPEAMIILQGSLHVTKKRSDSDRIYNNPAINRLNEAVSALADGKGIRYLDPNALFDDETGSLSADSTSDQTHLYARYCRIWGEWIAVQTGNILREESFDRER